MRGWRVYSLLALKLGSVLIIGAAALILSAEHHAFAWQSTFVQDEAKAERLLRGLTLPASVWPGAPSAWLRPAPGE